MERALSLETERELRKEYEAQLVEVGELLVKLGVLSPADIRRHGVRFALHEKLATADRLAHELGEAEGAL